MSLASCEGKEIQGRLQLGSAVVDILNNLLFNLVCS